MPDNDFPRFDDFYRVTNAGRAPLPWQSALAARVIESGWPAAIEIPTGLGKTSCIDIAVWALASQDSRPADQRTLPTRIWYVVNRRLLVDAAYARGRTLEDLLSSPSSASGLGADEVVILEYVAAGLRRIRGFGSDDDSPLVVSRLRGAAELGVRPAHPAQPSLIFATVPMFASTWLFRGYASSHSMRPIDAAHAGIDSLVLLDEAHLARPLQQLVRPVQQCDVGEPASVICAPRARPTIVALTATGDADEPFGLGEADLAHDVVASRLRARKPTRLVSVRKPADKLSPALADKLVAELGARDHAVAAVVFTNTARRAREVFNELAKLQGKAPSKAVAPIADADLVLLTGRVRSVEGQLIRDRVLDPVVGAPSGRPPDLARDRSLVVVATQTLEVGADLDFDVLVTESTGARALVQRMGRLNRLGEKEAASAVVVHPDAQKGDWPVYGSEPATVWERLKAALDSDQETLDLGPAAIAEVVGQPEDAPPRVAELLPAHLWEWAKTTTPPAGEAPVEPFFEGFGSEGPRLTVCWRAIRPTVDDGVDGDLRLVPSVHTDETIDLPFVEAKLAIAERLEGELVCRLAWNRVDVEWVANDRLRPSDIVILGIDDGLHDEHGWNPEATEQVLDISLPYWPGIPLDPPLRPLRQIVETGDGSSSGVAIKELSAIAETLAGEDPADIDLAGLARRACDLVAELQPVPLAHLAESWEAVTSGVEPTITFVSGIPVLVRRATGRAGRATQLMAADAFDDLCAGARSVDLEDHLSAVGDIARTIGRAVGLSEPLVAAVEAAGQFHDLGKRDPRFQRWLAPDGNDGPPVAKSSTPRWRWRAARLGSGWPRGGRHEALSARLLQAWLDENPDPPWDPDLVLHLAISHHGFGRPLVAPVRDRDATEVRAEVGGRTVAVSGDLGEADWDQPARFRRCCERYGYWGLALLEAVVRQADHLASSQAGTAPVEVA